jgi:hypothetical protein
MSQLPSHLTLAMMLLSDVAKPSAISNDKINGTQSLQHMFPAYKLSVYALQWLLPDTAQDSIIDVLGCTFDAFTFRCQLFYTSWRTAAFCAPLQKHCYAINSSLCRKSKNL